MRWGRVAALACASACALPSASELATGKGAGATEDGGALLPDGAPSLPVASQDGDVPVGDAGSEAMPGGGDGGDCPAGALLCDNFESTSFGAIWKKDQSRGGTVMGGPGRFGQGGLVAHVPQRTTTDKLQAALETTITLPAKTPFTVSFDLNVSAIAGVGIYDVQFFRFTNPYYSLGIRAEDYGSGYALSDFGDPFAGHAGAGAERPLAKLPLSTWTFVKLVMTFPDTRVHAVLTFDGAVVFEGDIAAGPEYMRANPTIIPGVGNAERVGAEVTVLVDRLVVTSP